VNDYVARGDISLKVKNSLLTSDVAWFGVAVDSIAVSLEDDETGQCLLSWPIHSAR
jgi:hypothetical protein